LALEEKLQQQNLKILTENCCSLIGCPAQPILCCTTQQIWPCTTQQVRPVWPSKLSLYGPLKSAPSLVVVRPKFDPSYVVVRPRKSASLAASAVWPGTAAFFLLFSQLNSASPSAQKLTLFLNQITLFCFLNVSSTLYLSSFYLFHFYSISPFGYL